MTEFIWQGYRYFIHNEETQPDWAKDDRLIFGEVTTYKPLVPPVNTFLDIGAQLGAWTCQVKRLFPKAEGLAIEPERSNYELLWKNTDQWGEIIPLMGIVGYGDPKKLKLLVNPEHSGCHRVVTAETNDPYYSEQEILDCFSLEECLELLKIDIDKGQFLDALKIDCEGGENDILVNCEDQSLQHIRQIVGEFHSGYSDFWSKIGDKLVNLGFEVIAEVDPKAHSTFWAVLK